MNITVDKIPERPIYQITIDGQKRYYFNGKPFRVAYLLDKQGNIIPESIIIIAEEDKTAMKFYGLPKKAKEGR